MLVLFKRLWNDESGLTMVEYGVAALAIVTVVALAKVALQDKLVSMFERLP